MAPFLCILKERDIMATTITPISKFYFNGVSLIPDNRLTNFLKRGIITFLITLATTPALMGNSYQEYVPIAEIKHQENVKLVEKIQEVNPTLKTEDGFKLITTAAKWAAEFNLPTSLVLGVIAKESNFVIDAIGNGSYGLMQVQLGWHTDKLKDAKKITGTREPLNMETNIYVGTRILSDCRKKLGNYEAALVCYNGASGQSTSYSRSVLKFKKMFDPYI